MNEQELTDLFARLGANNPAGWARSQFREGIPQLARFLFLREAWKQVVPEGDRAWIQWQESIDPAGPGGAIVPALARLKARDVDESDLTTLVRVMQWRLLFRLCYLLDDPGDFEPGAEDMAWRLFQVDDNDQPIAIIGCLHESVLETEPCGREMRP
jgi:hypothetical protein